jgi:hypothetical protein
LDTQGLAVSGTPLTHMWVLLQARFPPGSRDTHFDDSFEADTSSDSDSALLPDQSAEEQEESTLPDYFPEDWKLNMDALQVNSLPCSQPRKPTQIVVQMRTSCAKLCSRTAFARRVLASLRKMISLR